jgi:hypothetical protein
LSRGVPSSAMSLKSCSPGAMGGSGGEVEELGFRALKASGRARLGFGARDLGILQEGFRPTHIISMFTRMHEVLNID